MRNFFCGAAALFIFPAAGNACNVQLGFADSCYVTCFETGETIGNPYNSQGIQIGPTCAQVYAQRARQNGGGSQDTAIMKKLEQQGSAPIPPSGGGQQTTNQPAKSGNVSPECRAFPAMCSAYK